jgi:hypothetical protein
MKMVDCREEADYYECEEIIPLYIGKMSRQGIKLFHSEI